MKVYRDTTEPLWSHTIKVGNVTTFTVKGITKDNFLFGVRGRRPRRPPKRRQLPNALVPGRQAGRSPGNGGRPPARGYLEASKQRREVVEGYEQ
jgi:hypothetical protein